MASTSLIVLFALLVLLGSYLYYEVLDAQNADLQDQLNTLNERIRMYKNAHHNHI